jgi:urease accessory protein
MLAAVTDDWRILQWLDSAFPAGALAHSAGLEAAWQAGEVPNAAALQHYLVVAMRQAGRLSVPTVCGVCRASEDFEWLDRDYDLLLTNHIANRASRAQGQAMLSTATKVFDRPALIAARARIRSTSQPAHFPAVFGLVAGTLELSPERAAGLFLFVTLRSALSAAVRLGIIGPLEAQAIQHDLSAIGQAIAAESARLSPEDAAQVSPITEILQGTADRLYSRLFVS